MRDGWPLNFEGIIDNHHLALPNDAYYENGWIPGSWFDLCQIGFCDNCKIKVVSYAKNAICPKCHKEVYLT